MEYIAHIGKDKKIQTVAEHNKNTAEKAKSFSVPQLKELVYLMGLMHDIGKTVESFQKRINGANIAAPHAFYGAQTVEKLYPEKYAPLLRIAEYCIAGHHAGIPNAGTPIDDEDMPTLYAALKRRGEPIDKSGLNAPDIDFAALNEFICTDCDQGEDIAEELSEKIAFITRYCFSCLTDADSLDTESFCEGVSRESMTADFEKCLGRVNTLFASFVCNTELQKARGRLQQQAFDKIKIKSEIYLMNMPTGSGKTLCSVKFALERAIATEKKRIIYVIPYNSIIDQTAEIFEKTFGDCAQILRHQSTFSYEDMEDGSEDYRTLAVQSAENWDAQFIITTAVQFFQSLYGNKRGKLRKMHNMADSVIVMDEAHLMPENFLKPCLRAVTYITKYLNSEAVLLTATMPDYRKLLADYSLKNSKIIDLIESTSDFKAFKKCEFENIGSISDESLAEQASKSPSTLIVVNKRDSAKKLYNMCNGKKYHLSTYMTALDRQRVIGEIKAELARLYEEFDNLDEVPDERRITVVSTSLIEAGVDLDFCAVFRELSGLDSILQSAGRCNREGKRKNAKVKIFERSDDSRKIKTPRAAITSGIIEEFKDIASPESIAEYYNRVFSANNDEIKKHALKNYCEKEKPWNINFREYSEDFKMIDSDSVSIAVAQDKKSERFIEALMAGAVRSQREIQKYTFSVKFREFNDLLNQGAIDDFGTGVFCLTNNEYYDNETGISFQSKDYIL